jgi:hypothetical protein
LIWRRRRLATAGWGDLVSVAAALIILPLAIRAVRNVPPFLLAAIPAASRLLGPDFRFGGEAARSRPPAPSADHPRLNAALLAGISLVELVVVALAWTAPHPRLGWRPFSPAALEAARACPGPLYNRYYDGGYLIWFAPERPVFVDSRQDPYPLPLLLDQVALEGGGPYLPVFDRYEIRCALLPSEADLAARLRADGWRPSFADARWVVLMAPGPG